jgi:hypothetical protein
MPLLSRAWLAPDQIKVKRQERYDQGPRLCARLARYARSRFVHRAYSNRFELENGWDAPDGRQTST